MKIFLAHGALGIFDELVYLSPLLIFMLTAGLSWLRSFYASHLTTTKSETSADDNIPTK